MSLKKIVILCLCVFWVGQLPAWSQNSAKVIFSGTVVSAKTGETLPMVVVNIKELNMWTTSSLQGVFSFKDIKPGTYTVQTSCLGYKNYELKMVLTKNVTNYKLKLEEESLAMDEVVVTAKAGNRLNSSSNISKTALDHLQASSLADVVQLLPGELTSNPDLTKVNKIAIRDIPKTVNGTASADNTTSLGTSIIVDGAKISNDANLQSRNSNSAFTTSSESGTDARQIPVNNIESVEVIRGIASAEYGDLTSGAVIVKTKAGKSPLEVSFKTDPKSKQVTAGKGFALGDENGFFNVDMEYTYASPDNRTPAKSSDRFTLGLGYSNTFNQKNSPVSFNAKLRGYLLMDKKRQDPDKTAEETFKQDDKEMSLNIFGNWMLNRPWLTSLKYTLAGSFGRQYNYEKTFVQRSQEPTTSVTESGEFEGKFLPAEYYSIYSVEGKPVNVQAKLVANISGKYGSVYNTGLLGLEWNTEGNLGEGKQFGEFQPASGIRPRSFKDIPFLHTYSLFVEDKVNIPLGKKPSLELSAGARFTNIKTDAVDYDITIEPRFNARLNLIDNNWNKKGFQSMSFRAGWGIQHKMPTMAYLYPDPAYIDRISCNYTNDDVNFAVLTSFVKETNNLDLKIPTSKNFEAGIDVKFLGVLANLAYFREKLTDGFNFRREAEPFYYKTYDRITVATRPEFVDGQVMYDGKALGYTVDSTFASYSRPSNGVSIDKWGIEYSFNFGTIQSLKTSIIADGAYFHVKRLENELQTYYQNTKVNGKYYPYVGIYAGAGNNVPNGSISQRVNTSLRLVTHIPNLRFVVSLTAQCVWMDKTRDICEYEGRNLVYMKDDAGNIIKGDPQDDVTHNKYMSPVAYYDIQGIRHEFTEADALRPEFQKMIVAAKINSFQEDKLDPYFMCNLRLTKEIGKTTTFSFYANNFTNSRPKRHFRSNNVYQKMNPPIYFGAELKFKF